MNWLLAEELGNPFTHYDAFVLLVTKYKAPKFWFVSMEKKCVFLRKNSGRSGGTRTPFCIQTDDHGDTGLNAVFSV